VAEVREAVDFCRYYADQAERAWRAAAARPHRRKQRAAPAGRGVFVCISPWNFPLAIFAGQVVAALVAGNTVAAKPAEQTPVVARASWRCCTRPACRPTPLACCTARARPWARAGGAPAHRRRVLHRQHAVARLINRTLAAKDGPIVPLIAETGGLNAMVVDSTALPEQVVDAVVQSAFRSAGQRCSALRLLCVHEAVADGVIEMLRGAMAELVVGDPARAGHRRGPADRRRGPPPSAPGAAPGARGAAAGRRRPAAARPRGRLLAPVAFEIGAHRRPARRDLRPRAARGALARRRRWTVVRRSTRWATA
jgi:RHH-type transcriptional regulator, proline utilization regulon repressor / proline dehydrogenase / delta 1-pyrroline-5-carboxylate dehydrogenase